MSVAHCSSNETAPDSRDLLRVELAATADSGKPFVRHTYIPEGDGMLICHSYSHLQEVAVAAQGADYPKVEARE